MPYFKPYFGNGVEKEHIVRIVDNVVTGYPGKDGMPSTSVYQFKVMCSCQWEVLTVNMQDAERWKAGHLSLHGIVAVTNG